MSGCICPIEVESNGLKSLVRCGRCRYCRIRRKMHWLGRLSLEARQHEASRFLTLTYAHDPGVLDGSDFTKFMKRYRHHYGECRYFAVGEYGTKSGRGHWHAIIFGHAPVVRGHWCDNLAWSHGFSFDGTVTKDSIGYVAGYTLKSAMGTEKAAITRMSLKPGIGFDYLERLGSSLASSYLGAPLTSWPSGYTIGDRKFPLCDGGLMAFKRGFLNAGGLAPAEFDPETRHYIACELLMDRGTRIEQERLAKDDFLKRIGRKVRLEKDRLEKI